jgi:hypothetical protein
LWCHDDVAARRTLRAQVAVGLLLGVTRAQAVQTQQIGWLGAVSAGTDAKNDRRPPAESRLWVLVPGGTGDEHARAACIDVGDAGEAVLATAVLDVDVSTAFGPGDWTRWPRAQPDIRTAHNRTAAPPDRGFRIESHRRMRKV